MPDLAADLKQSREFEMQTYLSSLDAMYSNAMAQNEELYDLAAGATDGFTEITGSAILSDSRIVKILRYAIAPSISQMKFGQFFGLKSVKDFEQAKLEPKTAGYRKLAGIADEMAEFVAERIDRDRFLWIDPDHQLSDLALAHGYAKKWTCSIAADQNAQTRYRNWRKDLQELAIAGELVRRGYTKSAFSGTIAKRTDLGIGEFTTERKVKGRTVQKADLIVRSKAPPQRLVLIEAKAVGVELDSTKRIKECSNKASDWSSSKALDDPVVVAVIAGFFTETGISNLRASGAGVVWEHRLADLGAYL